MKGKYMFRILGRPAVILYVTLIAFAGAALSLSGQGLTDIRTPKASEAPHLNGPAVYGARTGHPFLYRIPCTGARPMQFSVKGLPKSMVLDRSTGIISGTTPEAQGSYPLMIEASNPHGRTRRELKIVVG